MNYFKVKEGKTINYFKALKEAIGGDYSDNEYSLFRGRTKIQITSFSIHPDFEIRIADIILNQPILQDKLSDEDPDQIHFYLAAKGKTIQNYGNKQNYLEADTPQGIFFYNGLFPMKTEYPADIEMNFVNICTTKTFIKELMPEASSMIETLFDDDTPVTYHTPLPAELEPIIKDIYYFKEKEFGKKSMVCARALELFTVLMQSIKQLNNKEELNGLHIEDYHRLHKIKNKLLSDLEGKIIVEELAESFGISMSKLSRDFKALFNTSVYQFYTHAKMDEAFRRLKTGKFSVMEVGFDLGYSNTSKFSQMFKKIKGVNPSEVIPV